MKTSELTGALLDYWTARAEGLQALTLKIVKGADGVECCMFSPFVPSQESEPLRYSTSWDLCGPLIEKGRLNVNESVSRLWGAYDGHKGWAHGETPQIAICRAVVRSVFGDEVDEVAICG